MADEAKTGNAKLGAAVVGGYLLGRFKKGRQAMRLAAYLNGGQTPPQMLIGSGRQGAAKVMENAQAKEIVDQLRGPLLEAVQKVVLAQVNSRVSGLSEKLTSKTQELQSGGKQAIDTTADTAKGGAQTAGDAVKGITGAVTGKSDDGGDETAADAEQAEQPEQDQRSDDTEGDRQADKGVDKPKQEAKTDG